MGHIYQKQSKAVKQRYLQTELQCDQIYLALIQQFGITNNNPDEDGGTALVTR